MYWSGGDLLSHVLRRSTIGATGLNGRVRDGIGCFPRAVTTRPSEAMRASALKVWYLRRLRQCWLSNLAQNNQNETSLSFQVLPLTDLSNAEPLGHNPWGQTHEVLRLLNRIKPIERLVPVN